MLGLKWISIVRCIKSHQGSGYVINFVASFDAILVKSAIFHINIEIYSCTKTSMNKSVHLFRYHKRCTHCIGNGATSAIASTNWMRRSFACQLKMHWIELDYSITATVFEHPGHLHKCNYAVIHYLHMHRVSIFFGLEVIVQLEYIHITMESCEHNQITACIGNWNRWKQISVGCIQWERKKNMIHFVRMHLFTCNYEHEDEFAHMSQLHDHWCCHQYQNGIVTEVRWKIDAYGWCKICGGFMINL